MPGDLKFVGVQDLVFENIRINTGPKGTTSTFRVTSPILANLVDYMNYVTPLGANCKLSGIDGGDDRSLEVEVPGLTSNAVGIVSELFFDQWELMTNESSDTIFANPIIVGGAVPLLNYNDKTVLSRLAREGGTIANAVKSCNSDIYYGNLTAPSPGNGGTSDNRFQKPSSAVSTQLTKEILKGQIESERPTRVLRHTSYCSAAATYNAARAYEHYIYTTAQLLTEVGSGWTYNLPNRLYTQISSFPFQYAPDDESAFYRWGWLKRFTREVVLANFMVEISTEYELALWSNLRYYMR